MKVNGRSNTWARSALRNHNHPRSLTLTCLAVTSPPLLIYNALVVRANADRAEAKARGGHSKRRGVPGSGAGGTTRRRGQGGQASRDGGQALGQGKDQQVSNERLGVGSRSAHSLEKWLFAFIATEDRGGVVVHRTQFRRETLNEQRRCVASTAMGWLRAVGVDAL